VEGNCVNGLSCNCDAKYPTWFRDAGYVTGDDLPIKALHFGGLIYDEQRANFSVGPLECFGEAQT
jgi:hypothetical protein